MIKNLLLLLSLIAGSLYADSVGLNVNSEDVELTGSMNINNVLGNYGSSIAYEIDGSYLHTDHDDLFKAGFGASSPLSGAEGLTVTLGIESVFADSFVAIPFFGQAALKLPLDEPIPATSLVLRVDYAPSVLSFVDADTYFEYRFEADMEVIDNIHLFAGYRNIDTNYDTYDYTLNDSWYGGLKISF